MIHMDKKKILTVTFCNTVNYGAVLQAFALQKALIDCGYSTELLNYSQNSASTFVKVNFHNPKNTLKQIALNFFILLHYSDRKQLFTRFKEFNSRINYTKLYNSYNDIKNEPPTTDIVMVGSDQVWNITYSFRPEFFAMFADKDTKKVSYAASISNYQYNDEKLLRMKEALATFARCSVREQSAVEFLKDNFNINAECHVDPVFLFTREKWYELAINPVDNEKYILCYALTRNDLMQKKLIELKKKTGCKIIVIASQPNHFVKGDKYIYSAGPREFLGYLANAEYVVTTSFHGTALSILFNKEFYNFTIDYYSTRTINLLKRFNLEHRAVKNNHEYLPMACIDYTSINREIEIERTKAYSYLEDLKTL